MIVCHCWHNQMIFFGRAYWRALAYFLTRSPLVASVEQAKTDPEQAISLMEFCRTFTVVIVSPRYTSQTCSRCLHLGVHPSQSKFHCHDCDYQINADLKGAKSIAIRHDLSGDGPLLLRISAELGQVGPERFVLLTRSVSTKPETENSIYNARMRCRWSS
jgi:putative transposase-like DNA-binding protein